METSSETANPAVFRSNRGKNLQLVGERTAPGTPDIAARQAALEAKEAQLKAALATVQAAFDILGAHARSMVALVATVCVFAWAVYDAQSAKIIGATVFAAMVLWPCLWMDRR